MLCVLTSACAGTSNSSYEHDTPQVYSIQSDDSLATLQIESTFAEFDLGDDLLLYIAKNSDVYIEIHNEGFTSNSDGSIEDYLANSLPDSFTEDNTLHSEILVYTDIDHNPPTLYFKEYLLITDEYICRILAYNNNSPNDYNEIDEIIETITIDLN